MCLGEHQTCVYMCAKVTGTWCRLGSLLQREGQAEGVGVTEKKNKKKKTFVRHPLPCSQLEFHLFPHRNEMALIVGSDVW